jgi:inorganic pyrophosphatase
MIRRLKFPGRALQTSEVQASGSRAPRTLQVAEAPKRETASVRNTRHATQKRLGALGRVKSAVLRGLLAATLVGSAVGIGSLAISDPRPPAPAKPPQLQLAQQGPSAAAQDAAKQSGAKLDALPEKSRLSQTETLAKIRAQQANIWRDTKPFNADGTINGFVEIPLGDRNKFELDIEKNVVELDRVIHESVGGYPINYGFVPGTFSWDGDPFDVVVLGPKLESGAMVKGKIVGVYHMIDEKGFDPHLVISPVGPDGEALFTLDAAKKAEIGAFVDRYKKPDAHKGKWAKMVGWGDAADGLRFVRTTAGFFEAAR